MSKSHDDIITYSSEKIIVDHMSGEVTSEEKTKYVKIAIEPNYIKVYINTLLTFKELPKTLNPILLELLEYMTYADIEKENGGQLIVLNSYVKKQIADKLNIKINTIDKSLTQFASSGILKRVGRGTYQVNPNMFGKGEWKDIKAIRATFDFNTGEIDATIEKQEENYTESLE